MATGIPYCDETWNVVAGCTRCSPACENCWAIGTTHRLAQNPALGVGDANPYASLVVRRNGRLDWTGELYERGNLLHQPLHWRKSRVVFVCSQADLFHPRVSSEFIQSFLHVMMCCRRHTFLLLTKRPKRMMAELRRMLLRGFNAWHWEPDHIWCGASVWDQTSTERAFRFLSQIPGRRWLSIEPALGPVDVNPATYCERPDTVLCPSPCDPCGEACGYTMRPDWVVFGCESGPNRRPCEWDWARQVRDACQEADIPFYLKQLPGPDGRLIHAPELDGQRWLQAPWAKEEPCQSSTPI